MANKKTAISIQESLFDEAEGMARRLKISRSRLFVLALGDYIQRQQNRELLTKINAAYSGESDAHEKVMRRKARKRFRHIVEGDW